MHSMKTDGKKHKTQRLMNTANYKSVTKSARPSFEKMFSCKAFAGMTLNSEDLTFFLPLNLTSLVMSSGAEVNSVWHTQKQS